MTSKGGHHSEMIFQSGCADTFLNFFSIGDPETSRHGWHNGSQNLKFDPDDRTDYGKY
jgi:hypothetical protein